MFTNETALNYTKEYLKKCSELDIRIEKAFLFGSYVSGNYHDYSDIDLAIFSPDFTSDILKNNERIAKANIHFPEIEAHTFSLEEYGKDNLIMYALKKSSIEIPVS